MSLEEGTRPEDRMQAARLAKQVQKQDGLVINVGLIKGYRKRASGEFPYVDQDVKSYIEVLERLLAPIFALGDNENACNYLCVDLPERTDILSTSQSVPEAETPICSPATTPSMTPDMKYLSYLADSVRAEVNPSNPDVAAKKEPSPLLMQMLEKRVYVLEQQVSRLVSESKSIIAPTKSGLADIIDSDSDTEVAPIDVLASLGPGDDYDNVDFMGI